LRTEHQIYTLFNIGSVDNIGWCNVGGNRSWRKPMLPKRIAPSITWGMGLTGNQTQDLWVDKHQFFHYATLFHTSSNNQCRYKIQCKYTKHGKIKLPWLGFEPVQCFTIKLSRFPDPLV
jgi:hypothetical protein